MRAHDSNRERVCHSTAVTEILDGVSNRDLATNAIYRLAEILRKVSLLQEHHDDPCEVPGCDPIDQCHPDCAIAQDALTLSRDTTIAQALVERLGENLSRTITFMPFRSPSLSILSEVAYLIDGLRAADQSTYVLNVADMWHGGGCMKLYRGDGFLRLRQDLDKVMRTANLILPVLASAGEPDRRAAPGGMRAHAAEWILLQLVRQLPVRHRMRFAEEFYAELQTLANSRRGPTLMIKYSFYQSLRIWQLRMALQSHATPYLVQRAIRWLLVSEWRTWGLLGPLVVFAIVNVFLQQGWGSAFFTIPAVVAFYAGVEWLRSRWGVKVKALRRNRTTSDK
ncbi:hypothetical protein AB0C28_55940 [Nonomuraea sp. NPDC048892]|uniref:hypothetical protein n=1 Tax=Nonomuraea sp. NPDC048892 TaxID=3154624 RepID=UPI0033CF4B3C